MTIYPEFPEELPFKKLPKGDYEDDTLASPQENGLVITRPTGTRTRRNWTCELRPFFAEAADLLDEFVRVTVRGASGAFYVTLPDRDPDRTERVLVRFVKGQLPSAAPLDYVRQNNKPAMLYTATFQIQEV